MTAYHDLDTPQAMHDDAAVVGLALGSALPRTAYTDLYDGFAQDRPKARIEVSDAARRLADALHLHLD